MDITPVLRDIDDMLTTLTDTMVAGRASSYDNYQYLAGQYRGLRVARTILEDRAQQQETADE